MFPKHDFSVKQCKILKSCFEDMILVYFVKIVSSKHNIVFSRNDFSLKY